MGEGSTGPAGRARPGISRRTFITGAAGTSALGFAISHGLLGPVVRTSGADPGHLAELIDAAPPDISISVTRDVDLTLLDFAFYGFEAQPGSPPAIVPTSSTNVIRVSFPPQAIGEAVYGWADPTTLPVDPAPVLSKVAGPSRLCFRLDPSQTIPLPTMTASDLTDWSGWTLLVPPVAQVHGPTEFGGGGGGGPTPLPRPLNDFQTAIEFPLGMYLAPAVYESGFPFFGFSTEWVTRAEPLVSPAGVTDLWAARLAGSRVLNLPGVTPYVPGVSAAWCDDYTDDGGGPDPLPEHYIEYGYVAPPNIG